MVAHRKSSIKRPASPCGGRGSLIETGSLLNLVQTMVSVYHKELEYKVENLKYKKLEVMQPRIKDKSELPLTSSWWIDHRQFTRGFTVVID